MKCKIDNCDRDAMYQKQQVCQKHYFRFMRNGTYETILTRKYRMSNPAGYQKIYEPNHFLAKSDGYVYEHRFVYANSNREYRYCKICSKDINWDNLHIDHIDNDVTNNNIENLRPLCRNCNTTRDRKAEDMAKYFIEYNGEKKSIAEWARDNRVKVSYQTIKRRIMNGFSEKDALFKEKQTHKKVKTKKTKLNYMK